MPGEAGMAALLLFAAVLAGASLLSARAARTAWSNNALFIAAGAAAGWAGALPRDADAVLGELADLALFAVLFSDGTRLAPAALRHAWRLPGRALLLGLPLTAAAIALLGHALLGLDWGPSLLLGAVLSPTDPVFASALVSREDVPLRLRQLLSVESGLNDGLALPLVLGVLHVLGREERGAAELAMEIVLGAALGVALPAAALWLRRRTCPHLPQPHGSLYIVAVGLAVLALARLSPANEYIAAFCAGIVLASREDTRAEFGEFGEHIAELLKFAALLAFGAMAAGAQLAAVGWPGLAFGAGVLLLARPAALAVALAGSSLPWPERAAAAWFGPKGFASIVYALLVLHSGLPQARELFDVLATVVLLSILAHSSTDVLVARRLRRTGPAKRRAAPDRPPPGG